MSMEPPALFEAISELHINQVRSISINITVQSIKILKIYIVISYCRLILCVLLCFRYAYMKHANKLIVNIYTYI